MVCALAVTDDTVLFAGIEKTPTPYRFMRYAYGAVYDHVAVKQPYG